MSNPKMLDTPMRSEDGKTQPEAPLLAVVVTCWNYEAYVGRAIRSVLDQAEPRCELVIVDDGSTDGSWDVIFREGGTAYRIENSGQRMACLHGLDRTHAPFVLFLDADDELVPGSIAKILAHLDANVAKLQFSLTRIDSDGRAIDAPPLKVEDFRDRENLSNSVLRNGVYLTPPTSGNVFRRDVCEHLRDAQYDKAVDGVILFAAPFTGDVISLSDELGRYRIHDRNDSGVGRGLEPASIRRDLRRFVDRTDHLRRILARDGRAAGLVEPKETFFHLERSFYLAILENRRVPLAHLRKLIRQVWRQSFSFGGKTAMSAFVILAAVLPNPNAQRGLAYRLQSGNRSVFGLLHALL